MGRYNKFVDQEVVNAKLFRFQDSVFCTPNKTWTFPVYEMAIKVPKRTEHENTG